MFNADFFITNRQRLIEAIPNTLICIPAHCMLQESADLAYEFRQDSNFWYLTGLQLPDITLLIDSVSGESILLLPTQNDYQKEWDGAVDKKYLTTISGITKFKGANELQKILRLAQRQKKRIGYLAPLQPRVEPYGFYANPSRRILEEAITKIEKHPVDIRSELARLRQIKQPLEIQAIRQAIEVTGETLEEVKKQISIYTTEKEVENAITAGFFSRNSQGHAYQPIIASGINASIIHYQTNNDRVKNNELLLLDVGAKVDGYAADISRTWSIGKTTKRQEELYNVILELQDTAFSLLKPGISLKDYQLRMEKQAKSAFAKVGVVIERYPHGFSHFLGLDVHDAGVYDEPLKEGSVLTVEPGIYIPKERIGIRVEDNVLVTKNGIQNLSESIPKML